MSVATVIARPPADVISAATSSRVAGRRAASTTSAPWAARRTAAWRPSPGPTPETTQTFPASNRAGAVFGPSPDRLLMVRVLLGRGGDASAPSGTLADRPLEDPVVGVETLPVEPGVRARRDTDPLGDHPPDRHLLGRPPGDRLLEVVGAEPGGADHDPVGGGAADHRQCRDHPGELDAAGPRRDDHGVGPLQGG